MEIMRNILQRGVFIFAFSVLITVVAVLVTVRVWGTLEEGAYRSPMQSMTEEFTPRSQRLLEPPQAAPATVASFSGESLFQANGCNSCHSVDGKRKIGPSLRGIFGTTAELNDGSEIMIDDDYIVESILDPQAKRVAGFDDAAMPSYEGLVSLEEVLALTAYIKGLD